MSKAKRGLKKEESRSVAKELKDLTLVIAAGEALSDAVDCSMGQIVRVNIPAEWTAANISFLASTDGLQFFNVMYGSSEVAMATKAGACVFLGTPPSTLLVPPEAFWSSIGWLKIRSGSSSGSPVLQAADREITVTLVIDEAATASPAHSSGTWQTDQPAIRR
jgi:hypothetical protein